MTPIERHQITGLVLAGGEGRRMGGLDKGLVPCQGRPLAAHALARLAPQVGPLLISANRHLDDYAGLGAAVVRDQPPEVPDGSRFAGPMAGLLAGLQACTTPWLLCVPCDSPALPLDLATRLAAAVVSAQAPLAVACTPAGADDPAPRRHPVFCLLSSSLQGSLAAALTRGHRKLDLWGAAQARVLVQFDQAAAFRNINTPDDLRLFAQPPSTPG